MKIPEKYQFVTVKSTGCTHCTQEHMICSQKLATPATIFKYEKK